ncbi:MAG: S8 family serine peptidase, partial [Acidobacteriota bacterium]
EDRLSKPTLIDSDRIIGADAAWASGFTGAGQSVAILDTGVDSTHPAFAGKVVSEACYSTDDGSDADPVCPGGVTNSTAAGSGVNCAAGVDGCDHGTHVAGIAAGRSVTLSDGRTIAGVARNANVIAIQVFSRVNNASDCGSNPVPCALSYESDQILGLQRVRDLAMMTDGSGNPLFRIASVNMSLGNDDNNTSTCAGDARATAITNLRSLEIATVISAGNEGHTNGVGTPGCNPNAISVASTDKNDTVSSFSNNASFVSLLAPGGSIESSIPGGGYGFKSGTSMAAPQVTGAWAVYKASPGHGSDTVAAVLTQFQNTGVQITDTRNANPSNHVTRPRLRLERALGLFSADLRIVKTDSSDPATAGTNLTYTINVTNDGPDAADNVTVSDTLPANTTFVSNTVPAGWACTTPAVGSGGTVQCTKASVADDETATFSITVKVDEATPNGSTLSNTALVNSSVAFDPNTANNSDTETTAVIARADLEVTAKVDAPDPVVTNFPLVYTITLRNNGPSVAISVTLDEPLPGGALFNNCNSTGGGVCGGSGQNRNVTFVSLAVGATATVTIETIANCALSDGSIINNTATISAATVDPNPANNSASAATVAQNPPPVITCPTDRDVVALTPGSTTAIVNYPAPMVTDNCPDVSVVCVPASGTAFPLGLTTVNCTATDSGGATASCSFNVTVWDACIQDNMSKDYLLFNTFTGDYKFVRCSADLFTMIGRGQITRVGSVTTLHDDSRVDASFDRALIAPRNTGTATIRRRQPDTVFPLKDRNILDNSPTCP